ncbi:MAG: hypothetical protein K8Q97_00435 [Candidatus Andersenbacteria bacterium]|nr:hypothetical protein [Candidatus Andersenbacteria bacterium]
MHVSPQKDVEQSIMALWRNLPMMVLVGVLAFGIAYAVASKTPPSYEVHFSYMIAQQQRDASPAFRYDGYYSISGTELFSATLASLIMSPEQIVSAYASANIPLASQDPIDLAKQVKAEKAASQLVQVTVVDASKSNAEALARAVDSVTQNAVSDYNKKNKDTAQFSLTQTNAWTGTVRVAVLPIALITLVFALAIAALIVLFYEALKRGED